MITLAHIWRNLIELNKMKTKILMKQQITDNLFWKQLCFFI